MFSTLWKFRDLRSRARGISSVILPFWWNLCETGIHIRKVPLKCAFCSIWFTMNETPVNCMLQPFLSVHGDLIDTAARDIPDLGLKIADSTGFSWRLTNWRTLSRKLTSPEFTCGGHTWCVYHSQCHPCSYPLLLGKFFSSHPEIHVVPLRNPLSQYTLTMFWWMLHLGTGTFVHSSQLPSRMFTIILYITSHVCSPFLSIPMAWTYLPLECGRWPASLHSRRVWLGIRSLPELTRPDFRLSWSGESDHRGWICRCEGFDTCNRRSYGRVVV